MTEWTTYNKGSNFHFHSFNQYLLSAFCEPGPGLGLGIEWLFVILGSLNKCFSVLLHKLLHYYKKKYSQTAVLSFLK